MMITPEKKFVRTTNLFTAAAAFAALAGMLTIALWIAVTSWGSYAAVFAAAYIGIVVIAYSEIAMLAMQSKDLVIRTVLYVVFFTLFVVSYRAYLGAA